MSYDGLAEADAILAKLQELAGGRFMEQLPDDQHLERDSSGAVRPLGVVEFGLPFQDLADRTMDADDKQVYIMPFAVQVVAATPAVLRQLGAAVQAAMMNFRPTAGSGEVSPALSAGQWPVRDTASGASRFNRLDLYNVRINLAS